MFEVMGHGKRGTEAGVVGTCEVDAELIVCHPRAHGGRKILTLVRNGVKVGMFECEIAFSATGR